MEPNQLIESRAKTHGRFSDTAKISQNLKDCMKGSLHRVKAHQRESLEMICVKMARILSGDPENPDHWDDIAGYAGLGKDGDR